MENIGVEKMKERLRELNPNEEFDSNDPCYATRVIFGTVPSAELVLPKGYFWHYDDETISNKGNTKSGFYEYFIYEYNADHFKPKKRKTFWERIFRK